MKLFMLFIDSNALHVSGVTRPSSGAQELCMQHSSCAPDDGQVTPETCRALLSIKSIKIFISLVIYMIFIYKDARSHEHKITNKLN